MDKSRLRTFLLGGAAGLLAGVLLAPRSGRELRGSLVDRAGEARERSRESYFDAQEQLRERVAASREGRRQPQEETAAEDAPPESHITAVPPRLRDVSSDVEGAAAREADLEMERSEELRRKVRETREKLRGRRDVGRGPEQ